MDSSRRLSLVVGAFVLVCLAGLMLAILSLTSEKGIFTEQYILTARFQNVQGLLAGAPVWLAGKSVGSVTRVVFDGAADDGPLLVVLSIDSDVQTRIRKDSVATIGTIGVLGDSYVELTTGSADEPVLEPGDQIDSINPINLYEVMARATRAMDSVSNLADNLDSKILVQASDAMSSFSELSQNLNKVIQSFSEEGGGEKAVAAIEAVSDIMLAIREGDGLFHRVIFDERSGEGLESIQHSLDILQTMLTNVNEVVEEVQDGDGVAHTLIYGSTEEEDVVMEFVQAGARLNSILGKVNEGDGSLALLLNDPSLFEDLRTLIGGAQRSTVVRTLIRMAVDQEQ